MPTHTPLTAFGAGPRAYALVAEAVTLNDGHQRLLLLWLAEHRPEAFSHALELVLGLEPASASAAHR